MNMGCASSKSEIQDQNKKLVGQSIQVGDISLANRVAMAPLTRMRADPKTGIPNDIMKEYYEQRAGFGLIITECSQISPLSNGFPGSGGIYSKEQVQGWKKVTDAVHNKGGKIILQIWHCGRATVPEFIDGKTPLGPSPITIRSPYILDKNKPHPIPKEMTQEDIDQVIQEFKKGAENAKEAGFDGVQLHAANGYLVDQFLRDGSNQRQDKYGGSIENRCRFMFEVLDVLIEVFGSQRISVRFSPTGRECDMYDSNPLELMKYALQELSKLNLAFVEVKRHGILDEQEEEEKMEKFKQYNSGRIPANKQIPNFYATLRPFYQGILMANDGFDPQSAQEILDQNLADLVAFGSLAIVNPDLPQRILNGWSIETKQDYDTWFTQGPKGYTDYEPYRQ